MAKKNNEFRRQTLSNFTYLGGVASITSKGIKYDDTQDANGIYILKVNSMANNGVYTTGWFNVEDFDSFYVMAKSTDLGSIKIEFSDEGDDDEVSDGDSVTLSSSSFAKIGGVSANAAELTGDMNYKFAKITYTATDTAGGKPLRVKLLFVR